MFVTCYARLEHAIYMSIFHKNIISLKLVVNLFNEQAVVVFVNTTDKENGTYLQ